MPPYTSFVAAFAAFPAPLRAASWMIIAAVGFTIMNATIRVLSAELPAFELVFLRNLAGLIFMLPWLAQAGLATLQTTSQTLYLGRAAVGFVAMLCWFSAVAMMPLAEATALSFTSPLFATIAAVGVLGEVVRARRWTAMVIGFAGALIVLRPGFGTIGLPELLVLVNAAFGGFNTVLIKQLTRTEPASAIVTFMTLYTTPMALIPALFVWVTPSWIAIAWIAGLGLSGIVAHQALTRAFAAADTSLVMSFDYARLPFIAVVGWLAFGEVPDRWTWVGAAVILGATVYIARREAVLARARGVATLRIAPVASTEAATVGSADAGADRRARP